MINIYLISDIPILQRQGAAYSRLIYYAKALTLNRDITVYLVSAQGTNYSFFTSPVKLYNNIYVLSDVDLKKLSTRWKWSFGKILGYLLFFKDLKKYINKDLKNIFFIYPGVYIFSLYSYLFIKKQWGYKLYAEMNEYKRFIVNNMNIDKYTVFYGIFKKMLYIDAKLTDSFSKYDGVICISQAFQKELRHRYNKCIRIPILVDMDNFKEETNREKNTHNIKIGFFGTIHTKKEALIEFIETLSQLKSMNISLIFEIYGSGSKSQIKMIKNKINVLNLNNNVFLYEPIGQVFAQKKMSEFDYLVLPRLSNPQTEYGFSTKLTEYLASGVATITTNVSDNALFLTHGHNSIILDKNSSDNWAESLYPFFTNREISLKIGKEGKNIAENYFDYRNYGQILTNFFLQNN